METLIQLPTLKGFSCTQMNKEGKRGIFLRKLILVYETKRCGSDRPCNPRLLSRRKA